MSVDSIQAHTSTTSTSTQIESSRTRSSQSQFVIMIHQKLVQRQSAKVHFIFSYHPQAPQQLDFSAPDTTGVHDLMGHDLMSPDDFNENDFDGNIILDQPDELNEISRSQNQNLNSISSSKKKDEDTKKSSEVSEKEELNANETAAGKV